MSKKIYRNNEFEMLDDSDLNLPIFEGSSTSNNDNTKQASLRSLKSEKDQKEDETAQKLSFYLFFLLLIHINLFLFSFR